MRSVLSPFGNVYRIGGDEFAALIRVPGDQVEALVRQLETAFEQAKGAHCPEVTVSVGWVRAEDRPDLSLEEMGQEADRRMYEDKRLYYRKRGMPPSCIR
jgi:GGDEF domain-containing protein